MITELAALATARSGSDDSAAAMVAISAPTIEKITVTMATVSALGPSGKKPPLSVRLEKSIPLSGHTPKTKAVARIRKTRIAATLMPANQYSNAPKDDTLIRLVPVISSIRISEKTQIGTSGIQYSSTLAPATASKPTTMTQKYQYSQPTEKPAQLPSALRA